MRELRIPTRKTNPIHNDVPENTTFLLLDQPSGEANTTGTPINKMDEVAINAKTANWKAIVIFLILQFTNKRTIPFDPFIDKKFVIKKCIIEGFTMNDLLPLLFGHGSRVVFFFTSQIHKRACWILHVYIQIEK
jgi:hypothetical protein